MNETIVHFLSQQTCATICCVAPTARPYCFNCFYAFNAETGVLHYKSSHQTHHSALLQQNNFVAGTILADKLQPLMIQGVQFEGVLLHATAPAAKGAYQQYHVRHPMAIVKPGTLWSIQINTIKMTDNSKGFGNKILWKRSEM